MLSSRSRSPRSLVFVEEEARPGGRGDVQVPRERVTPHGGGDGRVVVVAVAERGDHFAPRPPRRRLFGVSLVRVRRRVLVAAVRLRTRARTLPPQTLATVGGAFSGGGVRAAAEVDLAGGVVFLGNLPFALGRLHLFPRLPPDGAGAARRSGARRNLEVVVILGGLVEVDVQRFRAASLVERRALRLRVREPGRVVGVFRGGGGFGAAAGGGGGGGNDVLLRALLLEQHSHLVVVPVPVPVARLVPLLLVVVRERGVLVLHVVVVVVREEDVLRFHRVVRQIRLGVGVGLAVAVFHPRPLFDLAHR
mmetsp:Transcript_6422/g.27350  ORF Transcript_6422/g.27350 Transcript_6422/m.27350 type:complete len:306 (-) Transcript_6422:450-1367(-)